MAGGQWLAWCRRLGSLWIDAALWASPAIHAPQLALQAAARHQQARRHEEAQHVVSTLQTARQRTTRDGFRDSTTRSRHPYHEAAQTVSLK